MIKKFNLDDIIDVVGSPIKKNTMSLGIDVAQIKTGMCLLRTDDKFLYIEGLYTLIAKKQKNTLHQMVDKYVHEAVQIREQLEKDSGKEKQTKILIIEDCWFGKSVWTTKILAKFAVIVYLVFKKWATVTPDPIQPTTARKRVGFKQDTGEWHYQILADNSRKKVWDRKPDDTKDQIYDYLAEELGVEIDDEDLADGFVLALAGLVESEEIANAEDAD
jgi:hypothetical protein